MQNFLQDFMHGKVFFTLVKLFLKRPNGELGMGRKSGFMMIYGYLVITMAKFFPLILNFQEMTRLNPSLILK